MLYLYNLERF